MEREKCEGGNTRLPFIFSFGGMGEEGQAWTQDGTILPKTFHMMKLIIISSLQTFLEVPTSVQ